MFFQFMKPDSERDAALLDKCRHEIISTYKMVELTLRGKDEASLYYHGNRISMADLSLLPALRICYSIIPFDMHPVICEYYEKHAQMPEFKSMGAAADEVMEMFKAALKR